MNANCNLCGEAYDTWECQSCGETYCQTHWHETELGMNVECSSCERKRLSRQDPGSFNDMTEEEFSDILHDLATVDSLLSIGDVYAEAKEHFNNDVLEAWAGKNYRCTQCGAKLDDDGECCGGCDD